MPSRCAIDVPLKTTLVGEVSYSVNKQVVFDVLVLLTSDHLPLSITQLMIVVQVVTFHALFVPSDLRQNPIEVAIVRQGMNWRSRDPGIWKPLAFLQDDIPGTHPKIGEGG